MKRFRKLIFWLHLPMGAIAGLVILLMSVTGVLLTYEKQMIAWADRRAASVSPPSGNAESLPIATILANARDASGAAPASVTVKSDSTAPYAVSLAGGRTLFIDPFTGAVLGEGSQKVRSFFRTVTDLHRWLGANGENRTVARAITGACNLGFLFLVVSGFYLWWPRSWKWPLVRNVTVFKRGLAGKARDFNWHNVIGFWSAIPLFIVVISATVISYPWASNLVYRAVGEAPPPTRPPASREPAPVPDIAVNGLDDMLVRAQQQTEGWQSVSVRLPAPAEERITFTIDEGNGGQPQKRSQLVLDRNNGEILLWEPFSSQTQGRRLRSVLRFAHTGEVAGIAGQTIAGLASAGAVFLVWTGLALALRRFRAWLGRRSAAPSPAVMLPEGAPASGDS